MRKLMDKKIVAQNGIAPSAMKSSPTTATSYPTTSAHAAWEERGGTIIRTTSRLSTGGATGKRDRAEGDAGRCVISEGSGPGHLGALVTDPPTWNSYCGFSSSGFGGMNFG